MKEPLLSFKHIRVRFGNLVALNDISFTVRKQEAIALLGDNGAGKSTIIKALSGLCELSGGVIFLEEKALISRDTRTLQENGIEIVYQTPAIIDHLSVAYNFYLGREICGNGYFLEEKVMMENTKKIFEESGFRFHKNPYELAGKLSGGERQVLALVRAIFFCKRLLILDEPTAPLSEENKDSLFKILAKLKKKGVAILIITHKVQEVYHLSDRFIILHQGKNIIKIDRKDATMREIERLLISSHLSTVKEMAAGVAHQIRNPLAIMKVSTEMLKDDFEVIEGQKHYQKLIHNVLFEIDVLDLMVNNFFDFALTEAKSVRMCHVKSIIQNAIKKVSIKKYLNVNFRIQMEEEEEMEYPLVKLATEQIISSLLFNAVEASPYEGTIDISVKRHDHALSITIIYSGNPHKEKPESHMIFPLNAGQTIESSIGLSVFHRIFAHQNCSAEMGSMDGNKKFIRLVF